MSWTRFHSISAAVCAVTAAFVVHTFDTPVGAQTAPASAASGAASRGKVVYDGHCVECHGATGKGDGGAAHLMTPRPRDFTSGKYKIRSTESGTWGTAWLIPDEEVRSERTSR